MNRLGKKWRLAHTSPGQNREGFELLGNLHLAHFNNRQASYANKLVNF
jgi:hypothetical protein